MFTLSTTGNNTNLLSGINNFVAKYEQSRVDKEELWVDENCCCKIYIFLKELQTLKKELKDIRPKMAKVNPSAIFATVELLHIECQFQSSS